MVWHGGFALSALTQRNDTKVNFKIRVYFLQVHRPRSALFRSLDLST